MTRVVVAIGLGVFFLWWLVMNTLSVENKIAGSGPVQEKRERETFADRIGLGHSPLDGSSLDRPIPIDPGKLKRSDHPPQPPPDGANIGIWAAPAEFAPPDPVR